MVVLKTVLAALRFGRLRPGNPGAAPDIPGATSRRLSGLGAQTAGGVSHESPPPAPDVHDELLELLSFRPGAMRGNGLHSSQSAAEGHQAAADDLGDLGRITPGGPPEAQT